MHIRPRFEFYNLRMGPLKIIGYCYKILKSISVYLVSNLAFT